MKEPLWMEHLRYAERAVSRRYSSISPTDREDLLASTRAAVVLEIHQKPETAEHPAWITRAAFIGAARWNRTERRWAGRVFTAEMDDLETRLLPWQND